MNTEDKWSKPYEKSTPADGALGPRREDLWKFYPRSEEIPEKFKGLFRHENDDSPWVWRMSQSFFVGGKKEWFSKPRDGVDSQQALVHLQAVLRAMDLPHEHKIAAAAFLADRWFEL